MRKISKSRTDDDVISSTNGSGSAATDGDDQAEQDKQDSDNLSEGNDKDPIEVPLDKNEAKSEASQETPKKSLKDKSKGKKKKTERTSKKESLDEEYEVEKVMDSKKIKGKLHYLIRWKGYSAASDTWEPENTLSCPDLINKYNDSQKENSKGKGSDSTPKGKKKKSVGKSKGGPKRAKSADSDDGYDDNNDNDDEEGENTEYGKENSKGKGSNSTSKGKKRKSVSKSKGGSKRAKSDDSDDVDDDNDEDDDEDENAEYEVERILEVHHKKNGEREFYIHWKGWSNKYDSWEPESNLNCPELIKKFMSKVSAARSTESRNLRVAPETTNRFTLQDPSSGRRLSKRRGQRQRVRYDNAE